MAQKWVGTVVLLALAACADGEPMTWQTEAEQPVAGEIGAMQPETLGSAGSLQTGTAGDVSSTATAPTSSSITTSAMTSGSGTAGLVDTSMGDGGMNADVLSTTDGPSPADMEGPDSPSPATQNTTASTSSSAAAGPAPAPTMSAPVAEPPMLVSLDELEPSPNNVAQCPDKAPADPWGPCLGVPVYAVCDYGTAPAPYYTCICDWIHWICVGFQ